MNHPIRRVNIWLSKFLNRLMKIHFIHVNAFGSKHLIAYPRGNTLFQFVCHGRRPWLKDAVPSYPLLYTVYDIPYMIYDRKMMIGYYWLSKFSLKEFFLSAAKRIFNLVASGENIFEPTSKTQKTWLRIVQKYTTENTSHAMYVFRETTICKYPLW